MDELKKRNERYHIIQRIAKGDRLSIYSAINRIDGNMVAIKAEKVDNDDAKLRHEYKVYRMLEPTLGFPLIYHYKESSIDRTMSMELLGLNLKELFIRCNKRFSLVTTLKIATQLITRIEHLHEQHFIHRDIRPSNFCLGLDGRQEIIYCTNLSLAKRYRDLDNGLNHIPQASKHNKLKVPTTFSSINCMLGLENSRKDDFESLGYMIVYFLKGTLPWERSSGKKYEKNMILQKKQNISIERLADNLPKGIKTFLKYIKALDFEGKPDYDYMRILLLDVLSKCENNNDPPDWASLIINRDKIIMANDGITLEPAKVIVNNNSNSNKPKRPRTAFDRRPINTINNDNNNNSSANNNNRRPATAAASRSSMNQSHTMDSNTTVPSRSATLFLKQSHTMDNNNVTATANTNTNTNTNNANTYTNTNTNTNTANTNTNTSTGSSSTNVINGDDTDDYIKNGDNDNDYNDNDDNIEGGDEVLKG